MFDLRSLLPTRNRASRSLRQRRRPLSLEQLESRNLLTVFTPAMIRHAYGFDQISFTAHGTTVAGDGSGQTIAIVDAYDDPKIASDLSTFDRTFGLPDPVFTKATPQGTPAADHGWASEIALDVEWSHAIAPGAKILLVEAASSSVSDLLVAVDYARKYPGVSAVSMSFGGGEWSGERTYDSFFTTPAGHGGVTFVASSGDNGAAWGPEWPSTSPNVLAVGGTSLNTASNGTYVGETAWNGSGGGNSAFESRPAYQTGFQTSTRRSTPDVAYNADPSTGVYTYDSFNGAWFQVGGTSAGAPQWAALVAIANQGRALAGKSALDGPSQTMYALYKMTQPSYAADYHDIVAGSNGYSAHTGYDLVTGLGSPKASAVVNQLTLVSGSSSQVSFSGTVSHSTQTPILGPHSTVAKVEGPEQADSGPIVSVLAMQGTGAEQSALAGAPETRIAGESGTGQMDTGNQPMSAHQAVSDWGDLGLLVASQTADPAFAQDAWLVSILNDATTQEFGEGGDCSAG
jgi:subtilase family serine protease